LHWLDLDWLLPRFAVPDQWFWVGKELDKLIVKRKELRILTTIQAPSGSVAV
jgi:hypothetical protein